MFEVDFLPFEGEANMGAALALVEATVGGGDAHLSCSARRIGTRAAFGGFGRRKRLRPVRSEFGFPAALAVEAGQAEARFGSGVFPQGATAEGGEEGGLGLGGDQALGRTRFVLPIHPRV